jgi:hypothetical protein
VQAADDVVLKKWAVLAQALGQGRLPMSDLFEQKERTPPADAAPGSISPQRPIEPGREFSVEEAIAGYRKLAAGPREKRDVGEMAQIADRILGHRYGRIQSTQDCCWRLRQSWGGWRRPSRVKRTQSSA